MRNHSVFSAFEKLLTPFIPNNISKITKVAQIQFRKYSINKT